MRRIGIVTGARSDFWHLRSVVDEIRRRDGLEERIYATGMHLAARFGETVRHVEEAGYQVASRVRIGLDDDDPRSVARAIGETTCGFASLLDDDRPDLLVVLGDRFETIAAALAAVPFGIPLAHLHGGEVTEGSWDDQLRHALTKLAHLHFAATEEAAARIRSLGEEAWRVTTSGAPGLDRIATFEPIEPAELSSQLGLASGGGPLVVVLYHPETRGDCEGGGAGGARRIVAALERIEGARCVLLGSNADTGGRAIEEVFDAFAAERPGAVRAESLPDRVFLSLLAGADVLVGNSSAGLIEAPAFGLPAVNVGIRQAGRTRGANVIDCEASGVEEALRRALDPGRRASLAGMASPYGDGRASGRICDVLEKVELGPGLLRKRFAGR